MNPAEDYILSKAEPWRSILMELRTIVLSMEGVEEAFKWKLPFYSIDKKMYCFLNYRKTYVDLGIPYGTQLQNHKVILIDGENRKMLRSLRFYSLEDINHDILMDVLTEALQNLKSR